MTALIKGLHKSDDTIKRAKHVSRFSTSQTLTLAVMGIVVFLGCLAVASFLHEPVPRIHDEFSYLLMGDTFASGRIANPSPPLPEFFETFHVLVHPVYASKYFPAQGLALALGQKLGGHPAIGVWFSSAVACAATCWMLQIWVGPTWGFLGGILMAFQLGIYSYWSQTYWGGMVAALGGALFFGAVRRLWQELTWKNSLWLALGLVILATSRPLEGALAATPVGFLLLLRMFREKAWATTPFWLKLTLPAGMVLLLGGFAVAKYNRAITGSPWKPPYTLHEEQYQESPPFIFMPVRAPLTYSSPWIEYYYHYQEMRLYALQRTPSQFVRLMSRKLATWWAFYCGVLLTAPLVLPGLLRRGRIRIAQGLVFAGLLILGLAYNPASTLPCALIDLLALAQIVLLWMVFDDYWERIALVTIGVVLLETLFVKVAFPHYSAPVACLILFVQVQGLRRLWRYGTQTIQPPQSANRAERRRAARAQAKGKVQGQLIYPWRGFVLALPLVCLISLGVRVEARVAGWSEDPHGPDRESLPMHDWSLRRAELEQWLEQQPEPQLVFVRYSARHKVNFEWVYNHADLPNSHVIWARDLGAYEDQMLLKELPRRKVWLLNADSRLQQLAPYSEATTTDSQVPVGAKANTEQDSLDW
ncbi:MAG: hypothetical protein WA765_05310 [Candidatus Acidiferrum sp.]